MFLMRRPLRTVTVLAWSLLIAGFFYPLLNAFFGSLLKNFLGAFFGP